MNYSPYVLRVAFAFVQVDKVYAASKTFFELPVNVKEKYVRGVETNWGWGCLERER